MPVHPADSAIFGSWYGSDAMRAIFDDQRALQRMLEVEAALARVQAGLGIIPPEADRAISEAAGRVVFDQAALAESVRLVGYPVVGVVAALAREAGQEAGRWTHWGATTQDILDTALVLQIREGLALLRADLRAMVRDLAALADKHRHSVMAGRTHLQHALPITFGLKCAIWLQPLAAHL